MLCSWEGNRRSGVALAMRHRLSGPSTYGLNGLDRQMSTPSALRRGTARFTLPYLFSTDVPAFVNLNNYVLR